MALFFIPPFQRLSDIQEIIMTSYFTALITYVSLGILISLIYTGIGLILKR